MAARLPIDRTGILACAATDALQRLPADRIAQNAGAAVIQQDDMMLCGPSPGTTPDQIELYGFMRSPVAERGSVCSNTSRSAKRGITFSIPAMAISVSGNVRHMRPLPSDSTMVTPPVSATRKFAPQMAIFTRRNFSRR